MEVLRNMYSVVLTTPSRLLLPFVNAHSVFLNLHLLLALNIAWNVCVAWQKKSDMKRNAQKSVLISNGQSLHSSKPDPSRCVSHGTAGGCYYFLRSCTKASPSAKTDFDVFHFPVTLICFRVVGFCLFAFKAICISWLSLLCFFAV